VECPNCGELAPDDAKWCEACGQDLNAEPLPACVACGEREVAEEGYCLSCGHKQPEERDHQEFESGAVVAVTDRGKRHRHNEDAVAIGMSETGAAVLVVCDGVSSTPGSAEASLRAAAAARDLLVAGLGDEPDEGSLNLTDLLTRATEAAQTEAAATTLADDDEVSAKAPNSDGGPPSSTFVAAVALPVPDDGVELAAAWVGDSRAYWIGEEPIRLTGDDHEFEGSLVRWLGADTLDPTPDIEFKAVAGTGHLVVCSDGLWRYAQEPGELAAAMQRLIDDGHYGVELASGLVDFANDGGGHDNISVALWGNVVSHDWPAPDPTPAEGSETTEGSETAEGSDPAEGSEVENQ
jgi:serine/threonine protein phosphatase PrpC